MKVALITPWENAWIPQYRKAFEVRGHEFGVFKKQAPTDSDIVLHGWAIGTPCITDAVNLVFLRRYELFDGGLARIDWSKVDGLVCVNKWIADLAQKILEENKVSCPVHLIYNSVEEGRWTYRERKPGKKIGMACFIHSKKNLPLALQILAALPDDYELHIAGETQDAGLAEYLNHVAGSLGKVLYIYGQVPFSSLDKWWDEMDYCLSTSVSEGNPNNVIEAMAKGIKPVVHNWPGSEDQFRPWVFNDIQTAVEMIQGEYDSKLYRKWVEEKFSSKNIDQVVQLALEAR